MGEYEVVLAEAQIDEGADIGLYNDCCYMRSTLVRIVNRLEKIVGAQPITDDPSSTVPDGKGYERSKLEELSNVLDSIRWKVDYLDNLTAAIDKWI